MRPVLAVLLILLLASCSPDKKSMTAQCVATAKTQNPRPAGVSTEEYADSLGPSIGECMTAAGYIFFTGQPDCNDGSAANPACYARKNH
jgi:hypothetical protein